MRGRRAGSRWEGLLALKRYAVFFCHRRIGPPKGNSKIEETPPMSAKKRANELRTPLTIIKSLLGAPRPLDSGTLQTEVTYDLPFSSRASRSRSMSAFMESRRLPFIGTPISTLRFCQPKIVNCTDIFAVIKCRLRSFKFCGLSRVDDPDDNRPGDANKVLFESPF